MVGVQLKATYATYGAVERREIYVLNLETFILELLLLIQALV